MAACRRAGVCRGGRAPITHLQETGKKVEQKLDFCSFFFEGEIEEIGVRKNVRLKILQLNLI